MKMKNVLCILFTIIACTEAFIEFQNSRIYDESDFQGTGTIFLPNYCGPGCLIYISIPDASASIANNLVIQEGLKATSFVDANSKNDDGQKIPYTVQKGNSQVNFLNNNDKQKSAPILVWILRGDAPNIEIVEVYDADGMNRLATPAGLITIMNTEFFRVSTETTGPMTVSAITAGFDALGSGNQCTRVLRQENPDTYLDLLIAVRSPLITFSYDKSRFPDSRVAISATLSDEHNFHLAKPMFVTSPGYIGCAVKTGQPVEGGILTKTFRSSLYDSKTKFKFKSKNPVPIIMSADITVDSGHAVEVEASGDVKTSKKFNWAADNADLVIRMDAKELTFNWKRNKDDLDQYFMIRVEIEDEMIEKTSTAIRTTTVEPGPENKTTTTTVDSKDDLVYSTTVMPEEPIGTSTGDPDPEPDHATTDSVPDTIITTTSPSEPERTSTSAAQPEPIETTTSSSDPELEWTTPGPGEPVRTQKTRRTLPPTSSRPTTALKATSTASSTTTSRKLSTTSGAHYGCNVSTIALTLLILLYSSRC